MKELTKKQLEAYNKNLFKIFKEKYNMTQEEYQCLLADTIKQIDNFQYDEYLDDKYKYSVKLNLKKVSDLEVSREKYNDSKSQKMYLKYKQEFFG